MSTFINGLPTDTAPVKSVNNLKGAVVIDSSNTENTSSVPGINVEDALNALLVTAQAAFNKQDLLDRYWIPEGKYGAPEKILPLSANRAYYTYVIQNDSPVFSPDGINFYKYLSTYGDGSSGSMAFSNDGINWENEVAMTGLTGSGYHAVLLYDGVNVHIWYWTGTMNYVMGNLHHAISPPSAAHQFSGDQQLQEVTPGQVLTGTGGTGYRRGSYGPSQMFYNQSASNVGTDPRDYTFYGVLGTTSGSTESSVFVYSADGISFTRWDANGDVPIIVPVSDTFYSYSAHQVVFHYDEEWKIWVCYFTGSPSSPNNQNVGVGFGVNLLDVPVVMDYPLYSKGDDYPKYESRCYCPAFGKSADGEFILYKTGRSSEGDYATFACMASFSRKSAQAQIEIFTPNYTPATAVTQTMIDDKELPLSHTAIESYPISLYVDGSGYLLRGISWQMVGGKISWSTFPNSVLNQLEVGDYYEAHYFTA